MAPRTHAPPRFARHLSPSKDLRRGEEGRLALRPALHLPRRPGERWFAKRTGLGSTSWAIGKPTTRAGTIDRPKPKGHDEGQWRGIAARRHTSHGRLEERALDSISVRSFRWIRRLPLSYRRPRSRAVPR